jgi:lipid-A-disaccharide synthase
MKYYIIAGEASGDLHGSNLIKELKQLDQSAQLRCWGGDLMQSQGGEVVKHYRDLAFMGFIEVIKNLPAILRNFKFCKADILQFQPDVVVLIDYPGFNLRIARWAKSHGFKIVYYISPQVWAWKEKRVELIKKVVDKMLVILPFEEDFYASKGYKVEYIGHPLVKLVDDHLMQHQPEILSGNPVIALLPGSRKQEIAKKLPVMLETARHFPGYRFIVAKGSSLDDAFYEPYFTSFPGIDSVRNQTYDLLSVATAALVTSGTATLETALFGVPQVVCYKGSSLSYQMARKLIKIKYISLVNLIMNREVVKELVQDDLTVEKLKNELSLILNDPDYRKTMQRDYASLRTLLEKKGNASARAAEVVAALATLTG